MQKATKNGFRALAFGLPSSAFAAFPSLLFGLRGFSSLPFAFTVAFTFSLAFIDFAFSVAFEGDLLLFLPAFSSLSQGNQLENAGAPALLTFAGFAGVEEEELLFFTCSSQVKRAPFGPKIARNATETGRKNGVSTLKMALGALRGVLFRLRRGVELLRRRRRREELRRFRWRLEDRRRSYHIKPITLSHHT